MKSWFLCSLFLINTSLIFAAPMVSHVYDGDTVKVIDGKNRFKLRLSEIDAPEYNQTYGRKSKRTLLKLCLGNDKVIRYHIVGVDKYGRSLGYLHCNQIDANAFMLQNGHAWFNSKYSQNVDYQEMEQNARRNIVGLWKENQSPISPWNWRELHPHVYAK